MSERKAALRANLEPLTEEELARMTAVVKAGFAGNEAQARQGFADPSARLRAAAVAALVRMGAATDDDAFAALGDTGLEVRLAGAKALLELPHAPAVTLLANESNPLVTEALIYALGERREEAAWDTLCRLATTHPDPLCREAAVAAIANYERDSAIEILEFAAKDKPAIRRRVAVALAGLSGPRATALLARLAEDRDWQTRQIASEILSIEAGTPTEQS